MTEFLFYQLYLLSGQGGTSPPYHFICRSGPDKKKSTGHDVPRFGLWASQDLNPGPSGYENVANFEIPFFL